MQVNIGKLRPNSPYPKRLITTYKSINSPTTIIISDYLPENKDLWKKINPPELDSYIKTHHVYYRRKLDNGHLSIYIRPYIKSRGNSTITPKPNQSSPLTKPCSTCKYNTNSTCHRYPPPFPKIKSNDHCGEHSPI